MTPNRKISNAAPAQAQWVGNGTHAGAPLPLRFPFLHLALLTLGLTFGAVAPVSAQDTGPISFTSTESALTGTYACNGGAATPIPPVAASTTDVTGSNDTQVTSITATACGLPLYAIASANEASSASDTSTQDYGAGTSAVSQMSLLGGVLRYTAKTETDNCNANTPGEINCTDTTTVQNLYFAGQHITGTFTQPTTFNAVSVEIQVPGYCTGVALFTGQLTVAESNTQTSGITDQIQLAPVALAGTLTCVGLPLAYITVRLADEYNVFPIGTNDPETVAYDEKIL